MRDKTACFTGHRKIPFEQTEAIKQRLKEAIVDLINNGYCFFGAGGALGFDTMAAQAVLSLKAQYPHIRLILVLPCLTQTSHWSIGLNYPICRMVLPHSRIFPAFLIILCPDLYPRP